MGAWRRSAAALREAIEPLLEQAGRADALIQQYTNGSSRWRGQYPETAAC